MHLCLRLVRACLDLVAPANCVVCGTPPGVRMFCRPRGTVPGLRSWHDVPLCRDCARNLGPPCHRTLDLVDPPLSVRAACATGPVIAGVVHAWKYHGHRGLAWPLAALVARAAGEVAGTVLLPLPLHPRRRRSRGFNQAELLARLVARRLDLPVCPQLLRRARATDQQAKLTDPGARLANVRGAFRAAGEDLRRAGRPVLLVDDLVTSGATACAAAAAIREASGEVAGVLAVATAPSASHAVDTQGCGF